MFANDNPSERSQLIADLSRDIAANVRGWRDVIDAQPDCWILVDGHDRAEHRAEYSMHYQIEWLRLETLRRVNRYTVEPCARFFIDRGEREHLLPQRLHAFAQRQIDNGERALDQLNSLLREAA